MSPHTPYRFAVVYDRGAGISTDIYPNRLALLKAGVRLLSGDLGHDETKTLAQLRELKQEIADRERRLRLDRRNEHAFNRRQAAKCQPKGKS